MTKVMVIAEKPAAAERIASALDENGTPKRIKKGRDVYYECKRGDCILWVVYALGHLFELKQIEKGWTYPRLETKWVPKYEVEKRASNIKSIINLMKKLAKDVDEYIVATDYDIEGSLIGYLALKYACNINPRVAKRMIFSTLTKQDLIKAFVDRRETLDFPMIEAGCIRHQIDWLYGINLTRALTLAIKKASGWFKIVSTGRVQGPALAFVAKRERAINLFVPVPFWKIEALGEFKKQQIELEYSQKKIKRWKNAKIAVNELKGKTLQVQNIKTVQRTVQPPTPFNLSDLQREAYRHFGFKPSRTLAIAQRLYLDALISYPRTSSQQIPNSINMEQILETLKTQNPYKNIIEQVLQTRRDRPIQGKKTDPAHPAIHPTGVKPTRKLTSSEKKLYDLIVRRFIALFAEDAKRESVKVELKYKDHLFFLRGGRIVKPGWLLVYGKYVQTNEQEIPQIRIGDRIKIASIQSVEKVTPPPPRYNPASLLKELEKENLGTKATRAEIVDSLVKRGYALNDKFELSSLGNTTFETLDKYVPKILSAEFTRELEGQMDEIQRGTKNRKKVLETAKKNLLDILEVFQKHEIEIGRDLVEGLKGYWQENEKLGPCPKCGKGTLLVIRSPKSGKRFVGCSGYREYGCDQTFPLPQKGKIISMNSKCKFCGYQMIKIVLPKKTWQTCINWVNCEGRKEKRDAKNQQKATIRRET